jgi:hypothetical protein
MWKSAGAVACIAALTFTAPAGAAEALAVAKQGYFFVGGKYAPVGDNKVMTGQAYVEYQIPEKRTQPYPPVWTRASIAWSRRLLSTLKRSANCLASARRKPPAFRSLSLCESNDAHGQVHPARSVIGRGATARACREEVSV